jgi:transposase
MESGAALDTSLLRSDCYGRVPRQGTRRGFTEAPRCAVLSDGSLWIWNMAQELFPKANQILDRYRPRSVTPNRTRDLRRHDPGS